MTDRETLKLALEALEKYCTPYNDNTHPADDIIAAVKEALAQPAQEPVARVNDDGFIVETGLDLAPGELLYTAPQQRPWVGLTDEGIQDCYKAAYKVVQGRRLEVTFARAIEAKLKEKNA